EKKQKEKKVKKEKEKKEGQKRLPLNFTQNFTIGLNVLDRDEKRINDHVNLTFEDVIAETDSNQGFEFIWRLTFLLFNFTRFWIYRIVAGLIAIPLAIVWALVFAFVNVSTVWCCTPTFRVYAILLHYIHKVSTLN
ncbi:caveolin-like protein, partial [Leptotrombidium deliense]